MSIPTSEELKAIISEELCNIGFQFVNGKLEPCSDDKEFNRKLHAPAREAEITRSLNWIKRSWHKHKHLFANGDEVIPNEISPKLIEVQNDEEREVFRLARYTWSLPYTKGYGRRLQYLVIDESNNKLIGILGMQSPPLSFPARDRMINYPPEKKTDIVNRTMDIYTLGAIAPYSRLLGAKLIGLIAASNEVRLSYKRKYGNTITRMEQRELSSELLAMTTTSAYGKSSIYNRLRYGDSVRFHSIGFTEGYGAFHLERVYPLIRSFLQANGVDTYGGFGKGPRIKWQTMVRALNLVGLGSEILRHGVKREAFLLPLVSNWKECFEDSEQRPEPIDASFNDLVRHWHKTWLLPRSQRVEDWQEWKSENILEMLLPNSS